MNGFNKTRILLTWGRLCCPFSWQIYSTLGHWSVSLPSLQRFSENNRDIGKSSHNVLWQFLNLKQDCTNICHLQTCSLFLVWHGTGFLYSPKENFSLTTSNVVCPLGTSASVTETRWFSRSSSGVLIWTVLEEFLVFEQEIIGHEVCWVFSISWHELSIDYFLRQKVKCKLDDEISETLTIQETKWGQNIKITNFFQLHKKRHILACNNLAISPFLMLKRAKYKKCGNDWRSQNAKIQLTEQSILSISLLSSDSVRIMTIRKETSNLRFL